MAQPELCESCGVPLLVGTVFEWDEKGLISIPHNPRGRMVFYESTYIDSIFRGIGEIIGVSIEHIAIERKRRDTRKFMERIFPEQVKRLEEIFSGERLINISDLSKSQREDVLEVGNMVNSQATTIGMVYGYGNISFSELWEFWDTFPWRTQIIRNPYSITFFAADMLATIEAFEQQDMRVRYEEVAEETYLLSVRAGSHPIGLKDRLKQKRYELKPGDITYERCPQCNTPSAIGRCNWNMHEGTIIDTETGRRMAIFDPSAIDLVFEDLGNELGESITEVIVEAQRRYATESMQADNWKRSGYDFKSWAALSGLGNITSFKADQEKVSMTLENSCMPLAMVGMAQALYELAWGAAASKREWRRSDDGDLEIEITIQ
jgi:hypothetical protein